MIFRPFVFDAGPLEVNLYVMAEEASRAALLSDAGVFDPSVIDFIRAKGLRVEAILITHHHHDHIDALKDYLDALGVPQVFTPAPLAAAPGARLVAPGETFRAAGFEFRVIQTSGHTPESVSYHCAAERLCLVGDAIFAGAVGGAATDALHAEELGWLREGILTLPPETELWSGHGPATTVEIEAAANPFLRPGFTRLP